MSGRQILRIYPGEPGCPVPVFSAICAAIERASPGATIQNSQDGGYIICEADPADSGQTWTDEPEEPQPPGRWVEVRAKVHSSSGDPKVVEEIVRRRLAQSYGLVAAVTARVLDH